MSALATESGEGVSRVTSGVRRAGGGGVEGEVLADLHELAARLVALRETEDEEGWTLDLSPDDLE